VFCVAVKQCGVGSFVHRVADGRSPGRRSRRAVAPCRHETHDIRLDADIPIVPDIQRENEPARAPTAACAYNPNEISVDDARIRELMLINLFAVFNEWDPQRRLKAIAANYTEDVIWTDPERTFHGRHALNERAQELLDNVPDFVYTAAGPVQVLGDLGHLAFNHGLPEQSPAISGYDVALVRDGRIAVLYTLVNPGG
jgi:SnoaL-like domain